MLFFLLMFSAARSLTRLMSRGGAIESVVDPVELAFVLLMFSAARSLTRLMSRASLIHDARMYASADNG